MSNKRARLDENIGKERSNTVFFIGTEAGSGFLFIGSKDEYEAEIDDLSKLRLTALKQALKKNQTSLEKKIMEGIPCKEGCSVASKTFYCESVADYATDLANLASRIVSLSKQIKDFVPYRNRKVVQIYQKDALRGESGIAIIIEGDDLGSYWLRKEYLDAKPNLFDK